MIHYNRSMQRGFSLVELSVVLVILGLLTGGILAGQALIHASELRSISADITRFRTAFAAFQEKYNALPGDMTNATSYWTAAAAGAACITATSTGTATCDGNGSQTIGLNGVSNENFRAWQHLANAGMLEGRFSGVAGSGGANHAVAGENTPPGKISNSLYNVEFIGVYTAASPSAFYFDRQYGNVFRYGKGDTTGWPTVGAITAPELWNIDTKMDDGMPGLGTVFTFKSSAISCADSDDTITARYRSDLTGTYCLAYFLVR